MTGKGLVLFAVAVAFTGTLTACTSVTPSATSTRSGSERPSATAPTSPPGSTASVPATPSLSLARLKAGLLRTTDLTHGPFTTDDALGTNPGGVYGARHSAISDQPPVDGPFGIILDADTQPCSRLLNAIGYGRKAPAADAYAAIDLIGSDRVTIMTEIVAGYPHGVAAKIVSDVATAGSTCRTVHSKRATGTVASEPRSLTVPGLGDASAGIEWPMGSTAGSSDNVLAVVQVGDNVVEINGELIAATSTAKFDRTMLNQALAKAFARLEAAA
ncbi:hypothetical protein ACFYW8_13625 [Streptomyces sp. NPDC002742]|uniref:hypothetical protein n=1 Tax=Streptomyces sp. NPDC002742 TaxID=3364663 RepID=UPI003675B080